MALLNHAKKELNAKIVYYGPGLSGKTTNLEWIHKKMEPDKRGKLISLETKTDRTLFFDFLPVQIGEIAGYRMRFNVYTVPGQIFYNETRKMVLKGVDGVVFVADCQREMATENVESLKNLGENLASIDKEISRVPLVLQYNKMDLPNTLSVEELNQLLNLGGHPFFEAIAVQGEGVLTTLARITRMVAEDLRTSLFRESEGGLAASGAAEESEERGVQDSETAPAFLSAEAESAPSMKGSGQTPGEGAQTPPVSGIGARSESLLDPPLSSSRSDPMPPRDGAEDGLGEALAAAGGTAKAGAGVEPGSSPGDNGGSARHWEEGSLNDPVLEGSTGGDLPPIPPPTAGGPGDGVLGVSEAESGGSERWVDPSVIRFPPVDAPQSASPPSAESFSVHLEGAQGGPSPQEIEIPVRIRRNGTGEEVCFRLRIQIEACDTTH